MPKDIEAFERVFRETGTLQKARLAYGDGEAVSRKGMQGLNKTLRAIVERVRAEDRPCSLESVIVMPPARSEPSTIERKLSPEFLAQQWKPGEAGNPEGGSKLASFRAGVKDKLRRDGVNPIVEHVYKVASGKTKNDSDAIRAFSELRDTIGEKPVSNVNMAALVVMMPAESIIAGLDEWAGDED